MRFSNEPRAAFIFSAAIALAACGEREISDRSGPDDVKSPEESQSEAADFTPDEFALISPTGFTPPRVASTNPSNALPTDGAVGGFNPATGNATISLGGEAVYRSLSYKVAGMFGLGTQKYLTPVLTVDSSTSVTIEGVNGTRTSFTKASGGIYLSGTAGGWITFSATPPTYTYRQIGGAGTDFGIPSSGGTTYLPTKSFDNNTPILVYSYDASGRLVTVSDRQNFPLKRFSYNPSGFVQSTFKVTTPPPMETGFSTFYSYAASGNLINTATPDGSLRVGWESTMDSQAGVLRYFPVALYRPLSGQDVPVQRYAWYSNGGLRDVIDERNNTVRVNYSATQVDMIAPAGQTTTWFFNNGIITGRGGSTEIRENYTWDASATYLTQVVKGPVTKTMTYSALGNLLTETTVMGTQTFTTARTYATPSSTVPGNLLLSTASLAPDGSMLEKTVYAYNSSIGAAGNAFLTSETTYGKSGAVIDSVNYALDAKGNVLTTTNNGIVVATNVYDSNGFLIKTTDAAGWSNSYTYDQYDRLSTYMPDAGTGLPMAYTYDTLGRVTRTDNGVVPTDYSYLASRTWLASISNSLVSASMSYDEWGRVTSATRQVASGVSNSLQTLGKTYYADNSGSTTTVNGVTQSQISVMKNANVDPDVNPAPASGGVCPAPTFAGICNCPTGTPAGVTCCAMSTSPSVCFPY